jgi:hypothetical protein
VVERRRNDEILSPSIFLLSTFALKHSRRAFPRPHGESGEIGEKIALYFEVGACEVWICERDGTLKFHFSSSPEIRE